MREPLPMSRDTSTKQGPFGGFRKKTYRLEELVRQLAVLVP